MMLSVSIVTFPPNTTYVISKNHVGYHRTHSKSYKGNCCNTTSEKSGNLPKQSNWKICFTSQSNRSVPRCTLPTNYSNQSIHPTKSSFMTTIRPINSQKTQRKQIFNIHKRTITLYSPVHSSTFSTTTLLSHRQNHSKAL